MKRIQGVKSYAFNTATKIFSLPIEFEKVKSLVDNTISSHYLEPTHLLETYMKSFFGNNYRSGYLENFCKNC